MGVEREVRKQARELKKQADGVRRQAEKMKPIIKEPDALARKYIVAAIVVAVATWDIAFNFGAFKTVFFDKFFLIWVISLAIILADIALERKRILRGWALAAMLAPTGVLGLTVWSYYIGETTSWFDLILFVFTILVTLFFLPYAVYIILSITHSDIVKIKSRALAMWLVFIAIIIGSLGVTIGHYNRYFLTCESFQVSGNDLPDNCYGEDRSFSERF